MPAFLFIMVLNTLKFTIQIEKKRIFIFKYCKIDVKSAATLIFAATLITAPTVDGRKSFAFCVHSVYAEVRTFPNNGRI